MSQNATVDLSRPDGLAAPRRHWALIGLWIGMSMSVLDSSLANIALPSIAADLKASPASVTWIVTAYQIGVIMTLLPFSALGERLGYERVYIGGLVLFALMSLGCALASNLGALAAFRFLQGVGAAAMMGVNGALMRFTYPQALLAQGLGYNAVIIGGTAAAGPAVAALLLSLGSWHWLFLVNVPAGLASLALALAFLPRPAPTAQTFDWLSALLNATMFGALFLLLADLAQGLLTSRLSLMALVGGTAGAWLLRRVWTSSRPIIPLDLVRLAALRSAYAASLCAFAAQMCLLVTIPFLLRYRLGLDVVTIGLVILPMPLGVALVSPLVGRLVHKQWAGAMCAFGLCLFAGCSTLMATVLFSLSTEPAIAVGMGLCGIGFGLFQTPNNHAMTQTAPIDRAGAAAGMLSLSRLLGQAAGVLLGAVSLRVAGTESATPLYLAAILALCAAVCARSR